MGLLDFSGFVGDDTAKDEYGLTQADRRQPLWSGLLKAGMLGMAAGQDITSGQRAQLMGQIGGAVGDIPEAMNRQKAEAAQMQLRRQQFTAGQQKLEQAAKLKAYAQTPEYAELIKDVPEHVKAGLKFAIEAGDADSVQRLLTGIDTSAARTRGLDIREADIARKAAEAAAKEGTKAGRYKGTNERLQYLDDLEHEDPGSQKYWAAWTNLQTELKNPDGTVSPKMNLEAAGFRPPTFVPPGGKPAPTEPPKPADIQPGTDPAEVPNLGKHLNPDGKPIVINDVEVTKDKAGTETYVYPDDRVKRRYANGRVEDTKLQPPNSDQMKVYTGNMEVIKKVETALAELAAHPDAQLGFTGSLPLSQYTDERGERLRNLVKDLAGMTIHERAGASQTATELKQLTFVPNTNDRLSVLKQKLDDLKTYADDKTRTYVETSSRDVKLPDNVKQRYRGGGAAQAAPPAQGGGPRLNEGEQNLGPAKTGGFIIQLPNGDKVVRGG